MAELAPQRTVKAVLNALHSGSADFVVQVLGTPGGPLGAATAVITFVVPFTNPASISLAFSQTGASSGRIERIALNGKPTTTNVALEKNINSAPFTKYASWLAVGF